MGSSRVFNKNKSDRKVSWIKGLPSDPIWLEWKNLRDLERVNSEVLAGIIFQAKMGFLPQPSTVYLFLKFFFDRTFAFIALVVLVPIAIPLIIYLRLTLRQKFLFRQIRIGKNGRPFLIYKIRTLPFQPEGSGINRKVSATDFRVYRFARWLRRWKVDEIPQLWNVLKGDMSFVGPRPLPIWESASVRENEIIRYVILPGITGEWQCSLRASSPISKKVALDCEYVSKMGFLYDLKILFRTILFLPYSERAKKSVRKSDKNRS